MCRRFHRNRARQLAAQALESPMVSAAIVLCSARQRTHDRAREIADMMNVGEHIRAVICSSIHIAPILSRDISGNSNSQKSATTKNPIAETSNAFGIQRITRLFVRRATTSRPQRSTVVSAGKESNSFFLSGKNLGVGVVKSPRRSDGDRSPHAYENLRN